MRQKTRNYIISIIAILFLTPIEASDKKDKHKVIIYWDASLSQEDKNKDIEFEFLNEYFKNYPNSMVRVIVFNISIINDISFDIISSNWYDLKEELDKVIYDGASDFSLINTKIDCDHILYFTDGKRNFGDFKSDLYSPPIFTINSAKNNNKRFLQEIAFYNQGYFIDLFENKNTHEHLKAILNKTRMPRLDSLNNTDKNYIRGFVLDEYGLALKGVVVAGPKNIVQTSETGEYVIEADRGAELVFSYIEKESVKVVIGKKNIVNVTLVNLINELETVVVKKKSKIEKKVEKVNVNGMLKNKNELGFGTTSLNSKDLKPENAITLAQMLMGRVPGLRVEYSPSLGARYLTREGGHVRFFVDGIFVKRPDRYVHPLQVEKITVYKSIASTSIFGPGYANSRGGVILITTKSGASNLQTNNTSKKKTSKLKLKSFIKPLILEEDTDSNFMMMLKSFNDSNMAYAHYASKIPHNKKNVVYFVESAKYFFDINEGEKGSQILSNLLELFPKDLSVLKILAYHFEENNQYEKAQYIYRYILELLPIYPQGYLDLANSYINGSKFNKAINLLKQITKDDIKEVYSWSGVRNQLENDLRNLMSRRNSNWDTKEIIPKYFINPKYDLRIVIESVAPQTEYEIQYINPENKYFVLSHTKKKSNKILQNELNEGYNSNEFTLSNIEKGRWYLNLKVPYIKEKKNRKFRYIKVRIYTHFGKPNESLQTHIINLDDVKKEKLFASFTI